MGNFDIFLQEYKRRKNEPGFDPVQFANDFEQGLSESGFNRTQPETARGLKKRGFISETASALARGTADAAELWMRAVRTLDPEGGNDIIRDFATQGIDSIKNFIAKNPSLAPGPDVEEGVRRWWVEGIRSFIPSLSAALPGVIAGFASGGGPVGAAIGSTFGGVIFGLAEHDKFKEEVEDYITDNNLSEEDAAKLRRLASSKAIYSAITEGGLEAAANALEVLSLRLFRPIRRTAKGVVSKPIKELFVRSPGQIAKEAAITLPRTTAIEVGTEFTQEALETKFRQDIGLTDLSAIEAGYSALGPAFITTLLFMGAAGGANSYQRYSIRKALEDAKANPNARRRAVKEIADIVRATGQPDSEILAEQLQNSGNRFIDEGISIDLSTNVGVQNSLGEIIKGLRLGEITLDNTKSYENKLKEALKSEELTGADRITTVQLLQGISSINRAFEARLKQEAAQEPKVKKEKATASDQLRKIADDIGLGREPTVTEEIEKEVIEKEPTKIKPTPIKKGEELSEEELADIEKQLAQAEATIKEEELIEPEAEEEITEEDIKAIAEEEEVPEKPEVIEGEPEIKRPNKFFIYDDVTGEFEEIEKAKPILEQFGDFFVYLDRRTGRSIVTEGKTGVAVATGRTENQAIFNAYEIIQKTKNYKDAIKNVLLETGLSPRYTEEAEPEKIKPTQEKPEAITEGIDITKASKEELQVINKDLNQPGPQLSEDIKKEKLNEDQLMSLFDKAGVTYYKNPDGSFASNAYLNKSSNLEMIKQSFPDATVRVEDVDGFSATMHLDKYSKLIENTDFTDRIKQVILNVGGGKEEIQEGFMGNILEELERKTISGETEEVPLGPLAKEEKPETIIKEPGPTPENSTILADRIFNRITDGQEFDKKQLIADADEIFQGTRGEGTYTSKDAFDAMELGINKYISKKAKSFLPTTEPLSLEQAIANEEEIRNTITNKIASQQGLRSEEQEEFQQFSTPPEIAYAMAWLANIRRGDVVLEPSAGTGSLAAFTQLPDVTTILNELSERRANLLKTLDFGKVFQENAEQIDNILPDDIKPTVILTNPPFSATAGRIKGQKKSENVIRHLEQDLARLEPQGRMVALIGEGFYGGSQRVQNWIKNLKDKGHSLAASIFIDGKKYKKYGTTFGVRILVIDKDVKQTSEPLKIRIGPDEPIISKQLEGIRNERQGQLREVGNAPEQETIEPGSAETIEESSEKRESISGPDRPVSVLPDVVGHKEWDSTIGREDQPGRRGRSNLPVIPVEPEEGTELSDEERRRDRNTPVERPEGPQQPSGRGSEATERVRREIAGGLRDKQGNVPEGKGPVEEPTIHPLEQDSIEVRSGEIEKKGEELTDKIFEEYKPQKLRIEGMKPHQFPLVESAGMASVEPPNPAYRPNIPKELIITGDLTGPQLESIVYAGQAHEQILPNGERKGILIGDGPGVGKGRQISGIIMDNMNRGRRKAVWISANVSLMQDAMRDWKDIGGDPKMILKPGKIDSPITAKEGILFTTFDTLASGLAVDPSGNKTRAKQGVKNRMEQIINWLGGENFDGVIAYDEAHKAANAVPQEGARGVKAASLRGLAAVDLQKRLKMARMVYSSATGATEVAHLSVYERLGLWGEGSSFPNKLRFINEIKASGIAAMEVIARDMKAQGVYLARTLSYDDVTYDRLVHKLTKDKKQVEMYDKLAEAWQIVLRNIDAALGMTGANQRGGGRARANAMAQFWGAELRFFNQVILAMQMPTVIKSMEEELRKGNAVVIQLVNTNEAAMERQLSKMSAEGDIDDFVDLTPREILMQYLQNAFPTQQMEQFRDEDGNIKVRPVFDADGNPVENREAVRLREQLLDELGSTKYKVPEGPLEQILNAFGHDKVAEVTGRKRRQVIINNKPVIQRRSRAISEKEVDAFMDDKIQILVFSDAGGTGRSYDANRRVKNQRKRIHYVLQPGYKADTAAQGMGRTHRNNQVVAPHYFLVTTDLEGQKRFLSPMASRLDQLGALTLGQRQAGSRGLFNEKDNLQSRYSKDALYNFFLDLYQNRIPGLNFVNVTESLGLNNLIGESGELLPNNFPDINRFLNRILALPVGFQNQVFTAFHNRLSQIIDRAIANGTLETGMQNFKAFSIKIKNSSTVFKREGIETKYIQFEAKHNVDFTKFDEAKARQKFKGFYKNKRSGHIWAVYDFGTRTLKSGEVIDQVLFESPVKSNYKVDDARNFNPEGWDKVSDQEAKTWWDNKIKTHKGFRTEDIHLISGALLPIWDRLPKTDETTVPMKIIRIQTDDGERFIGRQISSGQIQSTLANLGASAKSQEFNLDQVVDQILESNAVIRLANGWRIKTSRVGGEDRIELKGDDVYTFAEELKKHGVFSERVQFDTRFFIPTGSETKNIIEKIIANRPIVEVMLPQSPSLDAYNQAKKNIRDSFGNISMGVDPTIMKDMAVVGMYHFKRGLKTFIEWSKAMLKDLGERAKQYLRQVWRNVRTQGKQIDNETNFENELISLAKEERTEKEMQKQKIEETKELADTGKIDEIVAKYITHNPYNVLHNKESKDKISEIFKDIKDEDISFWSRVTGLPWWKAKKFKEWKRALGIEIKRGEDRNLLKLEFGKNVFEGEQKKPIHEMFGLTDKQEENVTLVIYEGDAQNREWTNKELEEGIELSELGIQYDHLKGKRIKLNEQEMQAYRAWQISMRKMHKKVVETMEELIYRPYRDEPWLNDLKKLVRDKEQARFENNVKLGLVEDTEEIDAQNEISEDDIPKNLDEKQRKAFINAFIRVFKPKVNIENLRRRMGKIKGYAPRLREDGSIKIDIFDSEGKKIWSEISKNERTARRLAKELIDKYKGRGMVLDEDFNIKVEQANRTPEFLYQQVTVPALERFMNKALKRLETKEDIAIEELDSIRESMTEALAEELQERGFGRHMMKRRRGRPIGGYKITEGKKILAGYISGMAGFITKQKAAYEHGLLLSSINVALKPQLYEEITIYTRNMLRNQTRADLISSRVRTMAFVWYLSGQLKTPVVNFTQNWVLGIPTLAKFTTGARRKYNKAFFDVARKNFTEEERLALKEAEERGITGDQLMQEIFGQTLTHAGKAYRNTLKILSFPFSYSEIYNRKAAFLARFRAGIEKGETYRQAFDAAREFVFDVHFLYGKQNQALIATGGTPFSNIIRTSFTFRNYTFNYLNAIKHHIGDANLMLVGRSLAYLALLGGLDSLPFIDDLLDMFERLTGIPIRKKIQKELKDIGGEVLAEIGTHGLPSLIGVDLSGSLRIRFPDITQPSRLFDETVFGVYGALALKSAQATKSIIDGEALRAFEQISPVFIEKPLKAFRLLEEGATTASGKTIFTGEGKPLKLTDVEALTQALGFRPARLAFESEKFRQFRNIDEFFRKRRERLYRKLRFAKTSLERREVLQAIREYNREARKQRGAIPLITPESLRRTQIERPSRRFMAFSRQ